MYVCTCEQVCKELALFGTYISGRVNMPATAYEVISLNLQYIRLFALLIIMMIMVI